MSRQLFRLLPLALLPFTPQLLADPEAPTPHPLILQLDWRLNSQFAGPLLAAERGYYLDAGLPLEIRPLGDVPYSDLARVVAETPGMIGSIEAGLFLSGRANGLPLVALGTMFQASPLGLVVLTSSGIRQPADLAGRHVRIHDDGREALAALLTHADLTADQLTIDTGSYGMADLIAGQCDAKQGYLVDELVGLRLDGHHAHALAYRDFGYIAYSQVMFASTDTLALHRDAIRALLTATARGWQDAATSPAATSQFIHTRHAPDLSPEYLEASLREIIPLLTAENPAILRMSPETWQSQASHWQHLHPEGALPPLETWTDFTLLD